MSKNYDDSTDATKRFWEEVNKQRAMRGLPPTSPPAPELPPAMRNFITMNRGGATEAFIQMNEERIARGEVPIGASGQPIAQKQSSTTPQSDPATDAFFSGATDWEGKTPAGYENVKVRRFNQ